MSRLLFLYQSPRISPGKPLLLATEEMLQSMPRPPHCRVRACGVLWRRGAWEVPAEALGVCLGGRLGWGPVVSFVAKVGLGC